jgi:hypothetical protein
MGVYGSFCDFIMALYVFCVSVGLIPMPPWLLCGFWCPCYIVIIHAMIPIWLNFLFLMK